jgi:hypothetical protein
VVRIYGYGGNATIMPQKKLVIFFLRENVNYMVKRWWRKKKT